MIRTVLITAAALAPLITTARAESVATTESKPAADKAAWFREAKLGMFIHWGLYSIPAGEYTDPKTGKVSTNHREWYLESTGMPVSEYEKFLPRFNPVKFDAEKWAQAAADAGVKYLCITSKHHDGFAMWASTVTTGWNFGLTPMGKAGRDPLMELKLACEKRGIAFCLYHTIMDWHNTDYAARRAYNDLPGAKLPPDMDKFQSFLHASTAEVIRRYQPRMMWFDGFWESPWTLERGRALQAHLRKENPDMIVNDRVGPTAASTLGLGEGELFGDYATPEQFIPSGPMPGGRAWETCMTMNDNWGFNKTDHNWKPSTVLIRNLVDIASKGGNFLLNVGPDASGEIPAASLERLADIGRWTKANGEALYATKAGPFKRLPWGRATAKPGALYLHVFDIPESKHIRIPVTPAAGTKLTLLSDGRPVPFVADASGIVADLTGITADPAATVLKLTEPGAIIDGIIPNADGSFALAASDAEITGAHLKFEESHHKSANLGKWTDKADFASWTLAGVAAGKYAVSLDYSCPENTAGTPLTLSAEPASGEPLAFAVKATGKDWNTYKTVDIGVVTLPAGKAKLTLRAGEKPKEGVANIRSIRLVPVK